MPPLWTPSSERIAHANLTRFMTFGRERKRLHASDYATLYGWSIHKPLEFWDAMWDFAGIRGSKLRY